MARMKAMILFLAVVSSSMSAVSSTITQDAPKVISEVPNLDGPDRSQKMQEILKASQNQVVDAAIGSDGNMVESTACLPMNAVSEILVVNLLRVNAKQVADVEGEFYVGHISVGQPAQKMTVIFHTSSGNIVLPLENCKSNACVEHKRYSSHGSSSAMDVQLNGTLVSEGHRYAHGPYTRQVVLLDYSDSERGSGECSTIVVRDHICLETAAGDNNNKGCVDVELLAATSLPDQPFREQPSDGIVGLGLAGLSADPLCSFLDRFAIGSRNMLPEFGVSLGAHNGQILFGGHDESLYISPLRYVPVYHPADGFWQIEIKQVRVGDMVIDACEKGCRATVDTGAATMGIRDSSLEQFKSALSPHIIVNEEHIGGCDGPELIYDMGDFTIALPPNDYTDAACVPALGPLQTDPKLKKEGVYSLGTPMLRQYYAAFDWEEKRIGFARSTKQAAQKGTGGHDL